MKYLMTLLALLAAGGSSLARAEDVASPAALQIAVQKICPVSGLPLGDHGRPVRVKVGEEIVYLCCLACLDGEVSKAHWATIHANFAQSQKICPVMKRPLPANPKWTMVNGRIVFVCCPPCSKKVETQPAVWLPKVDELYRLSVRTAPDKE